MITPSTDNTSETSSLNTNKANKASNKVEIKDNHFMYKNGNNTYDSYLNPFEFSEEIIPS